MLYGHQKESRDWTFHDFESGGPGHLAHPLVPPSLKLYLDGHLAAVSPGAVVVSDEVNILNGY
jgi:hypothetical protein